jgi:predicted dehydrogenase
MQRREFLQGGLSIGAGAAWLASYAAAADEPRAPDKQAAAGKPSAPDELNLAVIGIGSQGRALIRAAMLVPGVRFRALCDIWDYARTYGKNFFKTQEQDVAVYEDYREMLEREKGLHAVLIATPDFVHAAQTLACLKAGLHVYCESPMSNAREQSLAMAEAARAAGKLLQIGYQRRSNPRYRHAHERLLGEMKLPGRIVQLATCWAQPPADDRGWPRRFPVADDVLKRHGYDSMARLRNWIHAKQLGSGLWGGLAAHQIDVLNWFLDATPTCVLASGGSDYYTARQWPDNVTALYEYPTPEGPVRAACQVLSTTSAGGAGHFEHVMGISGSVKMSENPKWTKLYREADADEWDDWAAKGYVAKSKRSNEPPPTSGEKLVHETGQVETYEFPVVFDKPPLQPHVQNFFEAVRGRGSLNCPPPIALAAEATVFAAYEAITQRRAVAIPAGRMSG